MEFQLIYIKTVLSILLCVDQLISAYEIWTKRISLRRQSSHRTDVIDFYQRIRKHLSHSATIAHKFAAWGMVFFFFFFCVPDRPTTRYEQIAFCVDIENTTYRSSTSQFHSHDKVLRTCVRFKGMFDTERSRIAA
jgi:hypothetical protein